MAAVQKRIRAVPRQEVLLQEAKQSQTGEKKTFSEKEKNTESARLSNPVEASKVPETESTSGTNTEDIPKSEKSGHGNPVAAALPSLGAILLAGTGVLYKMRSRRWVL